VIDLFRFQACLFYLIAEFEVGEAAETWTDQASVLWQNEEKK